MFITLTFHKKHLSSCTGISVSSHGCISEPTLRQGYINYLVRVESIQYMLNQHAKKYSCFIVSKVECVLCAHMHVFLLSLKFGCYVSQHFLSIKTSFSCKVSEVQSMIMLCLDNGVWWNSGLLHGWEARREKRTWTLQSPVRTLLQ